MKDKRRMVSTGATVLLLMLGRALTAWAGAPPGRYVVTTDTVLDTVTALVWQRDVPAGTFTWADAAAYCQSLNLGPMPGWRLPAVKELQSLVNVRTLTPAIDTLAFPSRQTAVFWSSSPFAYGSNRAWVVNFGDGTTYDESKSLHFQVRCVR